MSNLGEAIEEYYTRKGTEKATLHCLKALIESFDISIDKALTVLKVPNEEWEKYKELLNQ